jgi:hypothetical protein
MIRENTEAIIKKVNNVSEIACELISMGAILIAYIKAATCQNPLENNDVTILNKKKQETKSRKICASKTGMRFSPSKQKQIAKKAG